LEDLEELAGYIRKANPKGLPTYWTLATEFSYWRLPADTYNRTTTLPSSDPKFTWARAIIKRQLPSAWVALVGVGGLLPLITLLRGGGRSMIPPFAPLFKHMDGIAFKLCGQDLRASIIQNSTVSTQVTRSKFVNVKSLDTASPLFSHYEPAISTAIPMVGGQIQLLVISQL